MQKEKHTSKRTQEYFESILPTYIGTTVGGLAAKFEKLKEARYSMHVLSDCNTFSNPMFLLSHDKQDIKPLNKSDCLEKHLKISPF